MGKKGSWFSTLKRAFTSSSKCCVQGSEKTNVRETKGWGLGRSKNGDVNSLIPLYREPSSIEKILGDAEREQRHKNFGDAEREQQHKILRDAEREQQHKILRDAEREKHYKTSGDAGREQHHNQHQVAHKKIQLFKTSTSKAAFNQNRTHVSAIKIQAAYRGYIARRSYRALKGLVRLQGVMRGQSVKRQTMNAMRSMQLLVRVQLQIRTRRLQMMESQSLQKEAESSRWSLTHQSEAEANEAWDDSVLTKEEIDARMQRKVEAVIKRERALAYVYSHQLLKVTPKSARAVLSDIRSGGYPWWWNWLERHLPPETHVATRPRPTTPKPAPASLRPGSSRSKPARSMHDHLDMSTPRSSNPLPTPRAKHPSNSWQQSQPKHAIDGVLRDDDSLTSCPAYTVPRYMTPTSSAKAKVRSHVHEDEPGREGKRRVMFGLGSSIGSLRWGKGGSLFAAKESKPQRTPTARHKSTHSIGGMSVDSTISLPVGVGRKPFR